MLCTYRSDELQRRHPLLPTLQAWHRARLAETVTLTPLQPLGVAEMIASIFDADEVADEFRDLIAERTEGNPFVVEEMLREAIERGDVYLAGGRWERRAIDEVGIPQTVRETILLRIGRLDDAPRRRPARGGGARALVHLRRAARGSATPTRRSSSSRSRRRSARSSSSRSAAPCRRTRGGTR